MDRPTRGGLVYSLGQLGQERLGFLLLSCHQVLANLADDLTDSLLALHIAQARALTLPQSPLGCSCIGNTGSPRYIRRNLQYLIKSQQARQGHLGILVERVLLC